MLESGGQLAVRRKSYGAVLRLTTLGGLRLSRGNENLTGAATQRRRLALLVLLAAAGERGLSRDKLLGFLWAESDEARARHALNQLLYVQRQDFEADRLFHGKKTLRLNATMIWTDLAALDSALADQDVDRVAELYRGPFLDGFFLSDAPGFDQWADGERERIGRRVRQAFVTPANTLDQQDPRGATDWWRRVAELDPLDSAVARRIVETLRAAGDKAGALRYGLRHRDLLQSELGVTPDASFTALLEGLARPAP